MDQGHSLGAVFEGLHLAVSSQMRVASRLFHELGGEAGTHDWFWRLAREEMVGTVVDALDGLEWGNCVLTHLWGECDRVEVWFTGRLPGAFGGGVESDEIVFRPRGGTIRVMYVDRSVWGKYVAERGDPGYYGVSGPPREERVTGVLPR